MAVSKNALPAGTLLSGGERTYRIVQVLGSGGFGITYLVEGQQVEGGKVISFYYAMKEHFLGRCCERGGGNGNTVVYSTPVREEVENSEKDFFAEAQRLQKIGSRHPNIVKVHEIFRANNTAYYVMEYLQGQSLRDYVKSRGSLPEAEMTAIMKDIIDAIGFLHANRMTHLDIKPDNIMLVRDASGTSLRPVLIDFGLSKHYDGEGHPTSTVNTLACSDGYSPIEQYGGITTFSPTSDIYALGATMLFCVNGRDPRKSTELNGADMQQLLAPLSPATANLVGWMMNPTRENRPRSAGEVLQALQAPAPAPVPPVQPATQPLGQPGPLDYGNPGAAAPGGPGVPVPPMPPLPPRRPGSSPRQRNVRNNGGKKSNLPLILGIAGGVVGVGLLGWLIASLLGGVDENELHDFIGGYPAEQYYELSTTETDDSHASEMPLTMTMSWNEEPDLDLVVYQPNGNYVYFSTTSDEDTGANFRGDANGGYGSEEIITWTRPQPGDYYIFAVSGIINNDSLEGYRVPVTLSIQTNEGHGKRYEATVPLHNGQNAYLIAKWNASSSDWTEFSGPVPVEYGSGDQISQYYEIPVRQITDASAVRRANNCVSSGRLRTVLLWNDDKDLDLYVNTPGGDDVYWNDRNDSSTGARHSGDNMGNSDGASEGIGFSRPGSGRYDIFASALSALTHDIPVKLVINENGSATVYEATLPVIPGESGRVFYKLKFLQYGMDDDIDESGHDDVAESTPAPAPSPNPARQRQDPQEYSYSSGDNVSEYFQIPVSQVSDSRAVQQLNNTPGSGPLKIALLWDNTNDMDLYVNTPGGKDVYWYHRDDETTGAHHSGDNTGSSNSGNYESINFTSPSSGRYDIFVSCYQKTSSVPVKVAVKANGSTKVYSLSIPPVSKEGRSYYKVSFESLTFSGNNSNQGGASAPRLGSTTSYGISSSKISEYYTPSVTTGSNSSAQNRAAGLPGSGPLKITLLWDASKDLDLYVNQPNSKDVYWYKPDDSATGAHHTGDKMGGSGSYESISWSNPASGRYDIFVHAFSVPAGGIPVKVVVKDRNGSKTYTTTLPENENSGYYKIDFLSPSI